MLEWQENPGKKIGFRKMELNSNDYVSIKEAADLHGVNYIAIWAAIKKGRLKFAKINNKTRIKVSDLAHYRLTLWSREKSMKGELIFDNKKGLYSVKQAAKMLGLNVQYIYFEIKRKKIKSIQKGSFYVLHIDDIEEYGKKIKKK